MKASAVEGVVLKAATAEGALDEGIGDGGRCVRRQRQRGEL